MNLERIPGSVFVSLPAPASVKQLETARTFNSDWTAVAADIALGETSQIPTIGEVFDVFLPRYIESTRWGRYIVPGPSSRVFDGTIFVYHNPCSPFWNLYNLANGLFSNLGIRLSKSDSLWEARIPIRCLTDKVFVDSGLEAVEKTLLAHTGIDPTPALSPATIPPRKPAPNRKMDGRTIKHFKEMRARAESEKQYTDPRAVAMARLAEIEKADDMPDWINELGETYGMNFSDFAAFTETSDHLDTDALLAEHGNWVNDCYWGFPSDNFWVAWRKAKGALKATGYNTIKLNGIWTCFV